MTLAKKSGKVLLEAANEAEEDAETMIMGAQVLIEVVEVKPPKSGLAIEDQRKIGYELKKMLDVLVDVGISSLVICGLGVDGIIISKYKKQ